MAEKYVVYPRESLVSIRKKVKSLALVFWILHKSIKLSSVINLFNNLEDGLAVVSDWDLSKTGFMTALKSPPHH